MKLQLEHHEIEKAVQEYVAAQGIKVEGKELTVKFSMTRVDGQKLVADLSIDDPKPVEVVKAAPKAAAKLGSVGAAIRNAEKPAATDPAKAAINQALDKAKEAAEVKAAELAAAGQTDGAVDPEPGASDGEAAASAAETEVAAPAEAEEAPAPVAATKATSLFG